MGVGAGVGVAVEVAVMDDMSMVAAPLTDGLAGKVEKGPSRTERLLGGRPRSFPVRGFPDEGQAEDTAGPWRRRRGGGLAEVGVVAVAGVAAVAGLAAEEAVADIGVIVSPSA